MRCISKPLGQLLRQPQNHICPLHHLTVILRLLLADLGLDPNEALCKLVRRDNDGKRNIVLVDDRKLRCWLGLDLVRKLGLQPRRGQLAPPTPPANAP